jgi:ribonuclease E
MAKRMLIDATHAEETRVVVLDGTRLEEFDFETSTKKQIKGNVYLAKVTRVEPSLQAAFVEYGGNRHGFLAFSEIHPDYYRIPVADREALIAEHMAARDDGSDDSDEAEQVENVGGEDAEDMPPRRQRSLRNYKIQDVIQRRQIMLVQVVKEERGNKGAALTTYLSLAGRYCVLMPNTPRGGGVSRKITSAGDRKRLKGMLDEFGVPQGMAVIVRTAGMERSKTEIKRDFDYLMRAWEDIRETTYQSVAPALIHEEGNLIKRAIRDLYSRDIDDIMVEGEEGYRTAKSFMKMLMPSHSKRVQPYRDPIPLMHRYQVEGQLDAIHATTVQLRSGGYIVINPTEALVSIDVNSGRATKERHIEETAVKTNLEAADEIARQLRLRDLAGLIVIDFIDMEENRNNAAVERRLKEAMKADRARIQIGRISPFGLLELSRQRLRPSLLEASTQKCPHCNGTGLIRSVESSALHVLRCIEEEGIRGKAIEISVAVPTPIILYIINQKRKMLSDIEARYGLSVQFEADETLIPPALRLERLRLRTADDPAPLLAMPAPVIEEEEEDIPEEEELPEEIEAPVSDDADGDSDGERGRRRRRRRRNRRDGEGNDISQDGDADADGEEEGEESETAAEDSRSASDEDEAERRRRRRGKRGGRRRGRRDSEGALVDSADGSSAPVIVELHDLDVVAVTGPVEEVAEAVAPDSGRTVGDAAGAAPVDSAEAEDEAASGRRRSRRRRRGGPADTADTAEVQSVEAAADSVSSEPAASEAGEAAETGSRRRRSTRRRRGGDGEISRIAAEAAETVAEEATSVEQASPAVEVAPPVVAEQPTEQPVALPVSVQEIGVSVEPAPAAVVTPPVAEPVPAATPASEVGEPDAPRLPDGMVVVNVDEVTAAAAPRRGWWKR